ncbi:MAG: hypothetical protein ICV73_29860 [Acetobacteraceae bacterium]|nr:hypothetical protein [Acetobacteraceae bacterium]
MVAGGHSPAGAVVRVEYEDGAGSWPRGVLARGHVLRGNDEVRGGTVLEHTAGDPIRHLRGG